MARRVLPPPERFTALDIAHIALASLMIPLGVVIIVRTVAVAVTVLGLLVGGAFVAFGGYRLWLAWSRWRLWQHSRGNHP